MSKRELVVINKEASEWLEKNTFHSNEFSDINKLYKLKKEQGLTISLGLPTMNVEDALGNILSTIKQALQTDVALIDQIAIIDAHSNDKTVEIAKEHGVEVYLEDEILPEAGVKKGKGEALWKSLKVLTGDIVIWIDSDIKNIHPRFVYGLIGPLLTNPEIQYVKAFYKRPIKVGETLKKTGGGRVTEIATRPLFNLFYPKLTGFIQPLSGEYGGRRTLLESVPFYTGYAVETALLIDIEKKYGLNAMAQVDLEERIHDNQTTKALGRMSFGIMQAFFETLDEEDKIKLNVKLPDTIVHPDSGEEGNKISSHQVKIEKRPPIKEIPGYNE